MNNLLSYCGLVNAKIRASDNYLPVQQQQGQVPRGGNGLQIPTSMEQMKGQATTLYAGMKEKIAPTPPPQPPSNDPQGGPMLISGGGDAHDTDHVIGGKIFHILDIR